MLLSIVIPVYRDLENLEKCIRSLIESNFENHFFEIVIVDNDCFGAALDFTVEECLVKIIKCEKEGAYAARNKGAKVSNGDYVAYVDADCIFDEKWLINIETIIRNYPDLDLIAGDVILFSKCQKKPNSFEVYDMILGIDQCGYAKKKRAVTANLVIKKESFEKLGGFDESRFSGGDHELCIRANRQGFTFGFFPELIVYHPARNSMPQLANKAERRVGGRIGISKLQDLKATYLDEYTREPLPHMLMRQAMQEELEYFNKHVWELSDAQRALDDKEAKTIRTRWVICNKGTRIAPTSARALSPQS